MIKGYMIVDFNNDLAMRYAKASLKSWECVSDIFEVELMQCVTPETLLPELAGKYEPSIKRSPQEIAAYHSHYRLIKRMAEGEPLWVMEHDAYLINEEVFRMLMTKWQNFPVAQIGMANEMYTMWPEIAEEYCKIIEAGAPKGPMGTFHSVAERWCQKNKGAGGRNIYWPTNWKKDPRWVNVTGIGYTVGEAYNNPAVMIHSPVTQVNDEKYGVTVQDRKNPKYLTNGFFDIKKNYTKEIHPDMHWVDLDSLD